VSHGGVCYRPSDWFRLVFSAIDDLRNRHSIGYTPEHPDPSGAYRRMHLTVKQKGFVVQAREGYYPG
jgi:hypothetical protein